MMRVFFCWTVLLLSCLVSSQAAPPPTFRVMTYNIHHAEGLDKRIDVPRIAALITSEKADIVALQEVDKGTERTNRRDLAAELAPLTGMTAVFSNNFSFQGGQYGNAVLTRFKIIHRKNTHYLMLQPDEQRGALQVQLSVHGKKLLFINTHIDFHPADHERILNVGELRQIIAHSKYPAILCGDFNCTPDSRPYQLLHSFLGDSWEIAGKGPGFTIPAGQPKSRIDYIWIDKSAFTVLKAWVPESEASDHRPVVAELQWK